MARAAEGQLAGNMYPRSSPRRPPSATNGRGKPAPRLSPARQRQRQRVDDDSHGQNQNTGGGPERAVAGGQLYHVEEERRGRLVEAVVRVRPRWPGRESANPCAFVVNDCSIEPNPAARRLMLGSRATSVGTRSP